MLSQLRLHNFRCFDTLHTPIHPGTTLIIGDNAQGKTTLLEAICVLLRLQSPRTPRPAELIRHTQHSFGIAGHWNGQQLKHLHAQGIRTLALNGTPTTRTADYLAASGLLVWMGNNDLELITGTSEPRRRYLDFLGTQLFPEYRPALLRYDKALKTRNHLLKHHPSPPWPQIDAYTTILAHNAHLLTDLRTQLLTALSPHATAAHHHISSATETLTLHYHSTSGPDLTATLRTLREQETHRRTTLAGPHRDDLHLHLNTHPATTYASEGQQRTLALALKLSQATLLTSHHGQPPLLLLDDIFGELDPPRRHALLTALPPDSQRIITTTHLHWLTEHPTPHTLLHLTQGQLHPA